MVPESLQSPRDAILYLGADPDLFDGLRARLEPAGLELLRLRSAAGLTLASKGRRPRALVLDRNLLSADDSAESMQARIATAAGVQPRLVLLAAPQESVSTLRARHPEASAVVEPPWDLDSLASLLEDLASEEIPEPRRLLIVDGDPREGAEIALMLRRQGVTAEALADWLDTQSVLEKLDPDLVLLDLGLPDGGGRVVSDLIRNHGRFHSLPIVYLVPDGDSSQRGEVLRLTGEDFVARPVDLQELSQTVLRRLRRPRSGDSQAECAKISDEDDRTLALDPDRMVQLLGRTIAEHPVPAPGEAVLFVRIDPELPSLAPFGEAGLAAVRPLVLDLVRKRAGAAYRGACMYEEGFLLWARCRDDRGIFALAEEIRAEAQALEIPMGFSRARITVSIGIGGFLPPADDAGTLISRAQSACAQARAAGGNRALAHETLGEGRVVGRDMDSLHLLLRLALGGQGFQLVFQPIVALRKKRSERYEVLLRLRGPHGDLVPPLDFLPVASRFGLLPAIDRWVLAAALQVLCQERDAGRPTRLMVFQSMVSLERPGWLSWVRDEILRRDLIRRRPIFEFNALELLENEESARSVFPDLLRLGIEICLANVDDNPKILGLLARHPIGCVKVSRDLVARGDSERLTRLVRIARQGGAKSIAAGIEGPEAIGRAWTAGAHYIQGNFIQFPQDSLEFEFPDIATA